MPRAPLRDPQSGSGSAGLDDLRDQGVVRDKIKSGEVRPPWLDQPLKSFADLKSHTQANDEKLAATLAGWDEAALEHKVCIPWFPEPPCVISAAEAIMQAVLHTQHHRGQCMTKLKEKGGTNSNVDYIIWIWKGRPAARYEG